MKIPKLPLALLFVSVAALLTSCDEDGFCLEGEGGLETRELELRDFNGVAVSGNHKVYISKGSRQRVEVSGQANVLDELEQGVENGVWDIEFDRCLRNHKQVEVYITLPELERVSVGGNGNLVVENVFETSSFDASVSGSGSIMLRVAAQDLEARISGSGTIRAAGVATNQDVSISGSGNYMAFDVDSREAKVSISGSGEAGLKVDAQLDVDISGSGKVYYQGSPAVNTSISGSGKVIKK
ncbi:head GIN domain-containing protein [Pontibacter oryzae]|uniref:DUF2807 domain-containing protein n=1 Tax=Pontibacter oryzae TaxID=2304593 RepID=A0A399RYD7_9BACT|nr:head GIN domain-containing protein [Pontibacter oryzae]RIJ34415.1 DUF2807 domain-containing protein [Pontibacter oryzae]